MAELMGEEEEQSLFLWQRAAFHDPEGGPRGIADSLRLRMAHLEYLHAKEWVKHLNILLSHTQTSFSWGWVSPASHTLRRERVWLARLGLVREWDYQKGGKMGGLWEVRGGWVQDQADVCFVFFHAEGQVLLCIFISWCSPIFASTPV